MRMFAAHLLVILSTTFLLAQPQAEGTIKSSPYVIEAREPGRLVLSILPFQLRVQTLKTNTDVYHRLEAPDFASSAVPGRPMLPQLTALLNLPAGVSATISVLESEYEEIDQIDVLPAPQQGEEDDAEPVFAKDDALYQTDVFAPALLAELGETGVFRGQRITRVVIRPVQYNPVHRVVRVYKKLKVEIKFSTQFLAQAPRPGVRDAELFQSRAGLSFLNAPVKAAPTGFGAAQDSTDWYNPELNYTKLLVREDGLFAVTYEQLIQAGARVDLLNLRGLKIVNRGQQIPVWIDGPQGTVLAPGNTLFFYGTRNRSNGDYFDFYSDENVYWLTSDNEPGLRYQLQPQSKAEAISAFYWQTVHAEKDNLISRTNSSSAIEPDEGWIWRFFFPNDVQVFSFNCNSILTDIETAIIRVRLKGTSNDTVNPDHHVRLSLNSRIIDEVFFDGPDELLFEKEIPRSWLIPGQNTFEIHLLEETGVVVNQIYLDWFEVIYPRKYVNQAAGLSFQPDEVLSGPTSFNLYNFSTPDVVVLNPASGTMWQPVTAPGTIIDVASAGFDDGRYVWFQFNSMPYYAITRGHHLAAINTETGQVRFRHFDTYLSPQEADAMAAFVDSLASGTVVLAGISDEGSVSMTEAAYQALESLGSTLSRQVGIRDSWALIGRKGALPGDVKETISLRANGPAAIGDTVTGEQAWTYSASFSEPSAEPGAYFAIEKSSAKSVSSILPDENSHLRNPDLGADYLVISHRNFLPAAQRLAAYRGQRNGYRTQVVDVQQVYDEFNFGIEHPDGIKAFVRYAFENWQAPAPTYLLLVGDANWDTKKRLAESVKENFVTSYGILVADNWFVSLDGEDDNLPDLFVGRIPAETNEQAEMVVDKIMRYEAQPFAAWNKTLLFLNGGHTDSEHQVFQTQASFLIQNYADWPAFQGNALRYDKTTYDAITPAFRSRAAEQIGEGVLWINFIGHAASDIWDIDIGYPDDWQNEILPFFTGMSCHSTRFANPAINSLGERFVLHPNGAAAYWGCSGFGYVTQDYFLLRGMFQAVTRDTVRQVGAATTAAKLYLWQTLGDQIRSTYVIDQYTLIGDPALQLKLPEKPELAMTENDLRFAGDFLLVSDSTTTVSATVHNYGLVPEDSFSVRATYRDLQGLEHEIGGDRLPGFGTADSVRLNWKIPREPGAYRVQIHADPENVIPEEDENNNTAGRTVDVFSSDLTLITPLNYGVVQTSRPRLTTSNSRALISGLTYHFEIDTTLNFDSPALQRSSELAQGNLVTSWQPNLPSPAVYFWRVRTFDGDQFGPWATGSFRFDSAGSSVWQQTGGRQFALNLPGSEDVSGQNSGVALEQQLALFEAISGGFQDENHAYLSRNGEFYGVNQRGHNLAVFDETDGTFLGAAAFDTYLSADEAGRMVQYIDSLETGRIVLVAIKDEGSVSMTEAAHLALETLGSALTRQVGLRNSWALIGKKGAPPGSVPEALHAVGEGPVALADSVYRYSKTGRILSPAIGPALSWNRATFDFGETNDNQRISFRVLGNRATQVDTLLEEPAGASSISLANIDAGVYKTLQLEARLSTNDGLQSPVLHGWSVDFTPVSDLVVGSQSLVAAKDTVQVGEPVQLQITAGNFGLSASDSFAIRILARESGQAETAVSELQVAGLPVDSIATYTTELATTDFLGAVTLRAVVDAREAIPEINETNNSASTTAWVARDTLSPEIKVTFDGREVVKDDFVASSPVIKVEIRDSGALATQDTAQISVLLDEQKVPFGAGPGQVQLIPPDGSDSSLKALALLQPALADGGHVLEVIARDASDNLRYFTTDFVVSENFALRNVMNYPNPFSNTTNFTYLLTRPAERVRIKIYTVSGRMIMELDPVPGEIGFNQYHWDGRDHAGDRLANGVYLYKIIAATADQQAEVVEKLVVVR